MKKSIFIITMLTCNLLLAQNHLPKMNYDYLIMENHVLIESSHPHQLAFIPHKDSIYEWDTLYISTNSECYQIHFIGPGYSFSDYHITWITPSFGYTTLVNGHEYTIGVSWKHGASKQNWAVFLENYTMLETDTLEFAKSDAIYKVELNPVDNEGTPFSQLSGYEHGRLQVMIPHGLGYYNYSLLNGADWTTYLSELPPDIKIQCSNISYDVETFNHCFFIEFPVLDGINQNQYLENQPDDFISTNLQTFFTNDMVEDTYIGFVDIMKWENYYGYTWYAGGGYAPHIDNLQFWNGKLHLIGNECEGFNHCSQLFAGTYINTNFYTRIESGFFEINNDSIMSSMPVESFYDTYKAGNNDTLIFGESSSLLRFKWENDYFEPNFISAIWGQNIGMFNEYVRPRDGIIYRIKDESGSVLFESLSYTTPHYMYYNTGEPGNFSLEIINKACPILNYSGYSKLTSTFTLGADDPNPPAINPFKFMNSDKKSVYEIETNDSVTLFFSAADYRPIIDTNNVYGLDLVSHYQGYQNIFDDSTKVFIKEYSSEIWQEINVEKYYEDTIAGYYYKSDLSAYTNLDSSALDLKIYIEDTSGNTSECTVSPAILIDGFIITGQTESYLIPEIDINVFPNPASSFINFQISSKSNSKVDLNIYDINGKNVLTKKTIIKEGENMIKLDLTDNSGNIFEPGVYFCVFNIDGKNITRKIIVD